MGSGDSINILNEPWLPCLDDPYVHTKHEAIDNKMVRALMITGEDSWDVDLINDIFEARDANLILSIPIRSHLSDSWQWKGD